MSVTYMRSSVLRVGAASADARLAVVLLPPALVHLPAPAPAAALLPQGMNLGVALPSWMFSKDKKAAPLMLLGLVGCGILLPLGLMSWYMLSSSKFTGPNQIMNDTFPIFMYSKFCVKESQVRSQAHCRTATADFGSRK